MKLFQNIIVAFSMYSRIPMPHIEWTKENMRYALCCFPLIGCVIGALEWLWYLFAAHIGMGIVFRTAVQLLLPVLITGGIHLDGLLDTADALSSHQPKERKLEILKDSHTGAFAIIACCAFFVLWFGAWSEAESYAVYVLLIGFSLSRALSGFGVTTIRPAKGSGLAYTFRENADRERCKKVLMIEIVVCAFFMVLIHPLIGACCVALALMVFVACRAMAMRLFGGTTGDLQGFFLCMCELVMTCTVALVQHIG